MPGDVPSAHGCLEGGHFIGAGAVDSELLGTVQIERNQPGVRKVDVALSAAAVAQSRSSGDGSREIVFEIAARDGKEEFWGMKR